MYTHFHMDCKDYTFYVINHRANTLIVTPDTPTHPIPKSAISECIVQRLGALEL
jgi:hypothetical protein